jgi:hypothetical protein
MIRGVREPRFDCINVVTSGSYQVFRISVLCLCFFSNTLIFFVLHYIKVYVSPPVPATDINEGSETNDVNIDAPGDLEWCENRDP